MKSPYKFDPSKNGTHSLIESNIGTERMVLDIGCNDGYIGKFSNKTNKFYGLDSSADSINEAKKVYVDAVQYDLNELKNLPWEHKFDIIILADVLEHVIHPDAVLQFFAKHYLKLGGKMIISLPNIANWQIRIKLLFGKFDYANSGIMDKTHLRFYTFKSAREFAMRNGLKITKVFGGASFFGPIIRVFPILKCILATNVVLVCENN